jgi:DNA-binding CsgD family transcriptional regulator
VTYLTPAEVAERLRVSVATVRRHRREADIIAAKIRAFVTTNKETA